MAGRVAELFAGVGGFRLGLERSGWRVAWSNQWEPTTRTQHASECYVRRFGEEGHICADIAKVMDMAEAGELEIPDHDLVVGGFPCQDYSVARVLSEAAGIAGKKGVLWWEILRFLRLKSPPLVLLENVDRLLKSPATQRGRDFAVMLACFAALGYEVEWRVVNAADYGFPQRRRRVFVVARKHWLAEWAPLAVLSERGTLARALPIEPLSDASTLVEPPDFTLGFRDLARLSETFGKGHRVTPFRRGGVMRGGEVWTRELTPFYEGERKTLRDVLQRESEVDERFFVPEEQLQLWTYLKGAKREPRSSRTGFTYFYTEGAVPFPEGLDQPSRTILTGEGGSSPSRFKHVVLSGNGGYRRLTPVELERLNGFPDGWTDTGMSDGRRAFMMGNALVVGLVERIGEALIDMSAGVSAGARSPVAV